MPDLHAVMAKATGCAGHAPLRVDDPGEARVYPVAELGAATAWVAGTAD